MNSRRAHWSIPWRARPERKRFRRYPNGQMSVQGHSQPDWAVRVMSGLAPIAAEERTWRFGRFVPEADISILYRHDQVAFTTRLSAHSE